MALIGMLFVPLAWQSMEQVQELEGENSPQFVAMVEISYYSPVEPSLFGFLSLVLIGSGLSFMALFFVYEMKVSNSGAVRSAFKELLMAVLSSFLLGFGVLFGTLWAGIYV